MQRVPATALSTVMWTDKYRPKKFSDLMGEEVSRPSFASVTRLIAASASGRHRMVEGMGQMRFPARQPTEEAQVRL